jgi:hypothetical protein
VNKLQRTGLAIGFGAGLVVGGEALHQYINHHEAAFQTGKLIVEAHERVAVAALISPLAIGTAITFLEEAVEAQKNHQNRPIIMMHVLSPEQQ